MQRQHVGVRDLLDRLRVDLASGRFDVCFRLYQVGQCCIDHVGARRVVVLAFGNNGSGFVEQAFPFVGESECGSVSH